MVFPYLLCLIGTLVMNRSFPSLHLFTFAPFLALLVLRTSFLRAAWIATLAGLTLDLLSSNFRFGLYSAAFLLTATGIYKLKNLIFEEKAHALAFYSMIAASLFTSIERTFLHFFGNPLPFSLRSLGTDLILAPFFDGLFAFFWFCFPLKFYTWVKQGKLSLFIKRRLWLKRPH